MLTNLFLQRSQLNPLQATMAAALIGIYYNQHENLQPCSGVAENCRLR
jgi:hypothetical protein